MGKSISTEVISQRIFLMRGQKVILDFHLAELYGVPTKSVNLAVKRNRSRFPGDFMFRLTKGEFDQFVPHLRFQFETSNRQRRGGRRYLPNAFTEQGVAMLSSILRSKKAVLMNIAIMRAFVRLREILSANRELARKLSELEQKVGSHDQQIRGIFETMKRLMTAADEAGHRPDIPKRKIGFRVEEPKAGYRIRL